MYDRREIDGAIAELENAEPTMQRVLDAFMDANTDSYFLDILCFGNVLFN